MHMIVYQDFAKVNNILKDNIKYQCKNAHLQVKTKKRTRKSNKI